MAAHSINSLGTRSWPCGATCAALGWRRTRKMEPADVFTFVGARDEKVDPEFLKWLETYEEGLEKFRARDFDEAKILFSRFLEFYPDDLLAKMYLESALGYEQAPPDEAWEAVEVFEKK